VQQAIDDLLSEEYRTLDTAAARTGQLRKLYYRVRPLMPRAVQLSLRKRYAKTQGLIEFPAWPIENSLMFLLRTLLWCVARASGDDAIPHIALWPAGKRCCIVLTHDVEQLAGVNNICPVVEIEKKYGVRSLWNFVPRRYPFERSMLTRLQDDGFEIGVHGLTHDGRLFESRKIFEQRAPAINAYGRDWGSVAFRSPATHRIYSWIADETLSFSYDSSYPDTDPYQPMPGGCCHIFPWFIGNKVEIPITLPQDHVLFETLRDESSARWHEKFDYVEEQGGMAVMIVHPDYVISPKRLRIYEEFVEFLAGRENAWFALPRDVAEWWIARRRSVLSQGGDGLLHVTPGPCSPGQELKTELFGLGPKGSIGANFKIVDGDAAFERTALSNLNREARSGL
jgi:peptidoglycan/xylan/chitin deacetylase (PgdA/CDA1 family)